MRNPRINLLPYREEIKKAYKVRYLSFLGFSLTAGITAMLLTHIFFNTQLTTQASRNDILERDVASLEKQNVEIKKLREEIAAAVARKQVVESLQANRSRSVMLFNQIVQPPANIYYKGVKQTGDNITLTGFGPSNTSVSALIKQVETSSIIFDPKLVESRAILIDGNPIIEFTLNAKIVDLAKVAAEKTRANRSRQAPSATGTLGVPQTGTPASGTPAIPVAVAPAPAMPTPATAAPAAKN